MLGRFCDKGQKCKISPNLPLDSLEVFICGESRPKFQMFNEQKAIGALTREKSKCHNWNTRKCRKSTLVWNFDPQLARRGNWERLWGREGRFPCIHISTLRFRIMKMLASWMGFYSKISTLRVERGFWFFSWRETLVLSFKCCSQKKTWFACFWAEGRVLYWV